jgi:hypothetical protein
MAEFKLGVSPLSNKIFAGRVLKNGTWAAGKIDVTDMAVNCVAQHLLTAKEKLIFEIGGFKYELTVNQIKPKKKP